MLSTVCNVECTSWKTLVTFTCSLNFTIDDFFLKRIARRGPKAYRETINQFLGKQGQSWSHASWVTNGELFAKKGWPFHFWNTDRKEKEKRIIKAIAKFSALNSNAMNFKQLSSYFTFLFVVSSLKSRLYMTFDTSQRRLCRYDQSILKISLRHLVSNVKLFANDTFCSISSVFKETITIADELNKDLNGIGRLTNHWKKISTKISSISSSFRKVKQVNHQLSCLIST